MRPSIITRVPKRSRDSAHLNDAKRTKIEITDKFPQVDKTMTKKYNVYLSKRYETKKKEVVTKQSLPYLTQPVRDLLEKNNDNDLLDKNNYTEHSDMYFEGDNPFDLVDMVQTDIYTCDDCTEVFSESSILFHHRKENHSHIFGKEHGDQSDNLGKVEIVRDCTYGEMNQEDSHEENDKSVHKKISETIEESVVDEFKEVLKEEPSKLNDHDKIIDDTKDILDYEFTEVIVYDFSGDRPKRRKIPCEYCAKQFTPTNLKNHVRVHTGERPFTCDQCNMKFTLASGLYNHKLIHLNQRKYHCERCNKRFRNNAALKRHILIHSEVGQFLCEFCSKTFHQKCNLKAHERSHTEEKPFKCEECDEKFTHNVSLRNHRKKH